MSLHDLQMKIERKEAKLAVIGLGYVGLPVACQFARVGFDVLGMEIRAERVGLINSGISPIEGKEPGLAELLNQVVPSGKFRATTAYQELSDRDVILLDVETPVDENNIPRYEALRAALGTLGPVMQQGALVIVESTIAPGTMQSLVLPLLEESTGKKLNQDFYLGNCPERVMPGKLLQNLRTVTRVVGGMTLETADTMVALYQHVVQAELDPTDCITAELVKTVENAYRDVQIAFANEVALICEAVGGDVWKVRDLVNKTPYRNMHLPGAGVGGHCIPKDPWLLAYSARMEDVALKLIPIARLINDGMPSHVAHLIQVALSKMGREMFGARVLILGYSYLENSDDTRNSPSESLVNYLTKIGAEVVIHDPYVPAYQGDLFGLAENCDAIVLMVRHQEYLNLDLNLIRSVLRTAVLVDGRGVFDTKEVEGSGLLYQGIGVGINSA